MLRSAFSYFSFFCLPLAVAFAPAPGAAFLVRDVRVFDGRRTLEHRSVLITDGRIARIGGAKLGAADAEVVDGRDRTLIPGLIDSHVHVADDITGSLRQSLVLGVTTVIDMFTTRERLERMRRVRDADPDDIADVRSAGTGATAPGGHPTQMGFGSIPTLTGASEAPAFVDARIAEGSDFIKIILDDLRGMNPAKPAPTLDSATVAALVTAAHVRGRIAVVHALTEAYAREAISAGADGLAHLFTGERATPDFGDFVARHHAFVIPTLSTLYTTCNRSQGQAILEDSLLAPWVRPAWRNLLGMHWPGTMSCAATDDALRQLVRAHVTILAGTDAPVPGTAYGASLHGELALLVADGMTAEQALAAATSGPARVFGLTDRGSIREGMRADLVLVEGDPTRDIVATRRIVAVWKRGVRVDRSR